MLRPDAHANAEVDKNLPRWRSQFGLGGRAMAPERRHVSLLGVGRTDRLPGSHVDRLCRRAARFSASPFEVQFDRIARFGRNSIVLFGRHGNPPTLEFRQMLADLLRAYLPSQPRLFAPHMTVLHDDDAPRREHSIDSISWIAREFVLIESFQGEGRHDECGRWDLQGGSRQVCEPDDETRSNISQPSL